MNLQSDNINELVSALVKAQGEMPVAVYDSSNPHFKSDYASYSAVRKACQAPLAKYGLAITHLLQETPERKRMMTTQLSHTSGQWMRTYLVLPQEKETPQGVGSGITYAKRYTLEALLAIASDEDDDGEEAEKTHNEKSPTKQSFITAEEAYEIETAVQNNPTLRGNILKAYGAEDFTKIEAKRLPTIWKGIKNYTNK